MERKKISFSSDDFTISKLIRWSSQFDVFTLFNSNRQSNNPTDNYELQEVLIAVGCHQLYSNDTFEALTEAEKRKDWHIVHLSYDLKNKIEKLNSDNDDKLLFPDHLIYIPEIIIEIKNGQADFCFFESTYSQEQIQKFAEEIKSAPSIHTNNAEKLELRSKISREEYIRKTEEILSHIQRGDIYEMNFCQEFYAENVAIESGEVYLKLNELSPMPFSVYSKFKQHHIICASPERYLAKRKNKIISQPIKGTARRGKNEVEDLALIDKLFNDQKERSENVMIVDLVRNDLSRTSTRGSVAVEELFAIKTYKQLHQMVSTITSTVDDTCSLAEIIRTTFPMGSMTGAPKIRAMQIIEEKESTKRGIYSGAIGYLTPNGDADFNVVIRSILYNTERKYLSFMVGSAITIGSNAGKEYEECLLKASAMMNVLQN
jgi:para-aminobenzoate synthetase component 1